MSASSDSLLSNASAKKSCPIEYKVMFAIVIVMAIVACVAVAVIVSSRSGEAVLSPFSSPSGSVGRSASSASSSLEVLSFNPRVFKRALRLSRENRSSVFVFRANGEQYRLKTLKVWEIGKNGISWTGQVMTKDADQHFATFSFSEGQLTGSVTCKACVHQFSPIEGKPYQVSVAKREQTKLIPPVPVEVSEEEAELSSIVSEIDDAVGADAEDEPLLSPAGGKVAGRALGADGGSSSVNSFRRMRILLVFNQATCTSAERVIAANVDNMLTLVFTNNMGMSNWELVYTCSAFSSGVPDRNTFASRVRALQNTIRTQWGGDLIIGIGEFTYELHWRAGGTAGPSVSAVSFATRAGAAELIVMPHELLHNFGCGHDRYNAFSNAGTYYCSTDSNCNYGYQSATHMTIQSYGTAMGGCSIPGPNPTRVYVLSGYNIPGTNTLLGVPCGQPGAAWNRGTFETNWNVIAGYYDTPSSCRYVSCPNPPPPSGCVCSSTPFASAPTVGTTSTWAAPTSSSWPTASPTSAPTSAPTSSPVRRMCATSNANKRSGPSTSSSILGTLRSGEAVAVVSVSGSWSRVRMCGSSSTFYVSSSLLRSCSGSCA